MLGKMNSVKDNMWSQTSVRGTNPAKAHLVSRYFYELSGNLEFEYYFAWP